MLDGGWCCQAGTLRDRLPASGPNPNPLRASARSMLGTLRYSEVCTYSRGIHLRNLPSGTPYVVWKLAGLAL